MVLVALDNIYEDVFGMGKCPHCGGDTPLTNPMECGCKFEFEYREKHWYGPNTELTKEMEKVMKRPNKLIRDKIPAIMDESGQKYETKTVDDKMVLPYLCKKVKEELKEFETSGYSKEELVDLMDVVLTFVEKLGYDLEDLEEISAKKYEERGMFDDNIILMECEDDTEKA